MITSINQLIFEIHSERAERNSEATRKPRTRWTAKEEEVFEHLAACYGSDYSLLGSFLPRKTEKQIRKKYRHLLRYRSDRLDRLEKQIETAKRKAYFDQMMQDDFTSSEAESRSPSPDELSQSLQ